MLMSSIKERKEVSLSQNTIALKGFVLSLQLVMVEAIPALTEVVNDGSSSARSGGGEDDDLVDEDENEKRSISPGHARDTDAAGKVAVHSIIVEGKEHFKASPELGWSDDEEDPIVDNLMTLVEQQFPFSKSSFIGGVTNSEVNKMREDAKTEAINRKAIPDSSTARCGNVSNFSRAVHQPDKRMTSQRHLGLNAGQGNQTDGPTEDQTSVERSCESGLAVVGKEICDREDQLGAAKSKRHKALPKSLVGQYECDMRLLNRARVARVDPNNTGGNIDYSAKFSALLDKLKSPFTIRIGQSTLESNDLFELVQRSAPLQPKVVDVIMAHIRSQFTLNSAPNQSNQPVFMDTQFVSQLSKLFTKFSKMPKKESFRFPSNILERFRSYPEAERYYLPFNLDKMHWVGVCIDCTRWSIVVMDCNIALRTDSVMVKEVSPIAQMFPYLLKQEGKQLLHKDARAMPIERPRCIPQNTRLADSGASAILLVQAHAIAGVDVCKCITADKIDGEVERLAVMFYEATVGML
ncbi:hypothetical protein Bca101_024935 [Brassica carinata]